MYVLFDKEKVTDSDYDYITKKMQDNFLVDITQQSKVIFGYNGIGKSSIYSHMKKHLNQDEYEFLEYEKSQDNFLKEGNRLVISAGKIELNNLRRDLKTELSKLNIKKRLSDIWGITQIGVAKKFGERVVDARRNEFTGYICKASEIDSVISAMGDFSEKLFIDNLDKLQRISQTENEIEKMKTEEIAGLLLKSLDIIDEDTRSCPICNAEYDDLYIRVKAKYEKIKNIKTEVLNEFKKQGYSINSSRLNQLVEVAVELKNEDLLQDYILSFGKIETRKDITKIERNLINIKKDIDYKVNESKEIYSNVLNQKDNLITDFCKHFEVNKDDIEFNDQKNEIIINLPRNASQYSTGEKNLMFFLYLIYSFLGSEKKVLILDDPISSLDLVNHYKIAFELIKLSLKKRVLVFTHSVELLNTLNSQQKGAFEYCYLEETFENLKLQNIGSRKHANVVTLGAITEIHSSEIIEKLKIKENSSTNHKIQKLFHYTPEPFNCNSSFSNHDLVKKIESFKNLEYNSCFYLNSKNKIELLAALRVWLEKKLYELIPEENIDVRKCFIDKDTIFSKINYLLPNCKSKENKIELPKNLTREYLMSKKVLLNQSVHYQSQVMPFAYAINLSLLELNKQIIELKNYFDADLLRGSV